MKKILSLALVFVMMFALVSCGKSIDSIEKNLEKAGYEVTVEDFEEPEEGVVKVLTAANEDGDFVTAAEYESSSAAKDAMEDAEAAAKLMDAVIERSGKVIIMASSEDAMKDAK